MTERHWANCPPPDDPGKLLKILRAGADFPLVVTICSRELVGCWVHFLDNRTQGCMKESCLCSRVPLKSVWRGYAHCIDHADKKQRLLEVTPSVVMMTALNSDNLPQCGLRGMQLRLWRPSRRKRAALSAEVVGCLHYPDMDRLPPPVDVAALLEQIWRS